MKLSCVLTCVFCALLTATVVFEVISASMEIGDMDYIAMASTLLGSTVIAGVALVCALWCRGDGGPTGPAGPMEDENDIELCELRRDVYHYQSLLQRDEFD